MTSATEAKQVATPDLSFGQELYERANDARRCGDHKNYDRLILELIDYNTRVGAAARNGSAP